ncbi:neuraminidase-like domain-containing protein, partial [Serratia quinivorans]
GYSTWAGVSQLAYYPENTIDPTLRIGQSGMMDEMLQQLAQSQLNSDTLEEGFRQYLTAFEQVANLKVASGYHDDLDIHKGNTWFIGYSQSEPRKYYWRSLDHSKGREGRFAANAWSEWREIACAITPYQGLIRPVLYRSRLYVLWVEEQQRKTADGKQDEQYYALKLSHIHYDGSWASPFSFDITKDFKDPKVWDTTVKLGLYSAANFEDDILTVALYQKQESYQLVENKLDTPYFGLRILADMTRAASTNVDGVMVAARLQLDTTEINRVNNALGGSYHASLTLQSRLMNSEFNFAFEPGDFYMSQNEGQQLLVFNPVVEVTYTKEGGLDTLPPLFRSICENQITDWPSEKGQITDVYRSENYTFTPKNGWPVSDCKIVLMKTTKDNLLISKAGLINRRPLANNNLIARYPVTGDLLLYSQSAIREGDETIYSGLITRRSDITEIGGRTYNVFNSLSEKSVDATLALGRLKNILVGFNTKDIKLDIYSGHTLIKRIYGNDTAMVVPELGFDAIKLAFGSMSVMVSDIFKENQLNLTLSVWVRNKERVTATTNYVWDIKVPEVSKSAISLHTTDDGAQYMELDCYRTRLNTLFAQQLIARASRGVDAVLSRETQSLMEPKLGKGTYVTLTLAQYDKAIHGSDRRFSIKRGDALVDFDIYAVAGGTLSLDAPTEVKFFIPQLVDQKHNLDRFYLWAHYQSGRSSRIKFIPEGDVWKLDTSKNGGIFPGLVSVGGLSQQDEPMDFSGANALYFWELFYYTPMMVASRLLQERDFSEANRWLRYVWDPADGTQRGGVWNTRPLDEDTTWNDDPLDSVDPDAVAQHDPMHYKMSTVMRTLDLLMARGDAAYRLLERDTLNEAKMWYVQALTLLGEKPFAATGISWAEPALGQAADSRAASHHHRRLSQMRSGEDAATPFSANSLIGIFLPQQNEKLLGYWQTLEQRLYNLRHHLAIDGQPLSLPIFATPADPAALLSAAAGRASGGRGTVESGVPALRFPAMLDNAKAITGQLSYFGSTLLGLIERQDAEAMSELLQNQASELMVSSLQMQQQTLAELDAERVVLQHNRAGVQSRFDSYQQLYQENVSAGEQQAMNLSLLSSSTTTAGKALHMAAAVADTVPNIYGLAVGGSRYGALFNATAIGIELGASATRIAAERIGQSEAWRRRRQEWEIQRNNAEAELKQLDAQLEVQAVRRQAAEMQQAYLQTQQIQSQAQLEFLQRKFSNKALYSWLRSRLTAIYFQFYDLTASRCMMAQAAWQWQTGGKETFIKPGAWQSTHAGLLCGESLQLNLAQMEAAWLKWNRRALEVTRTVSLAGVYRTDFVLTEAVKQLLTDGKGEVGSAKNGL